MADWAWNVTKGSHEILVAVVDTGIYYYHEDIWPNYSPLTIEMFASEYFNCIRCCLDKPSLCWQKSFSKRQSFKLGEKVEDFQLILYYNITGGNLIGAVNVEYINPGEFKVLNVVWDTRGVQPCRGYTLTAYVPPLLGERNVVDNVFSSALPVKVKMVGDVNGDSKIDIFDVALVSKSFGNIC